MGRQRPFQRILHQVNDFQGFEPKHFRCKGSMKVVFRQEEELIDSILSARTFHCHDARGGLILLGKIPIAFVIVVCHPRRLFLPFLPSILTRGCCSRRCRGKIQCRQSKTLFQPPIWIVVEIRIQTKPSISTFIMDASICVSSCCPAITSRQRPHPETSAKRTYACD